MDLIGSSKYVGDRRFRGRKRVSRFAAKEEKFWCEVTRIRSRSGGRSAGGDEPRRL